MPATRPLTVPNGAVLRPGAGERAQSATGAVQDLDGLEGPPPVVALAVPESTDAGRGSMSNRDERNSDWSSCSFP